MTFFKPEDFENNMNTTTGFNSSTITITATDTIKNNEPFKYQEGVILDDFREYLKGTYKEHYKTNDQALECFDMWLALGDSTPTFRNTALKYLWRYGKKNGNNKKDLLKAMHYILLCLYNDHYKKGD